MTMAAANSTIMRVIFATPDSGTQRFTFFPALGHAITRVQIPAGLNLFKTNWKPIMTLRIARLIAASVLAAAVSAITPVGAAGSAATAAVEISATALMHAPRRRKSDKSNRAREEFMGRTAGHRKARLRRVTRGEAIAMTRLCSGTTHASGLCNEWSAGLLRDARPRAKPRRIWLVTNGARHERQHCLTCRPHRDRG